MTAKVIRIVRAVQDVSQRELAQRTGISQAYLSQIERGHRRASPELLQRLLQALEGAAAGDGDD